MRGFVFQLAATLAFITAVAYADMPAAHSPLATGNQIAVEKLALELLEEPALLAQRAASEKLMRAVSAASRPDGDKTLQHALDNMVYAAALGAANASDSANPASTWLFGAPHEWFGVSIPGSGVGFDNPDNAYRLITVDGASAYEITLRPRPGALPRMYSIYLYDTVIGDGPKRGFDVALAGFRESELEADKNGAYRITLDTRPAEGRINHMRNPGDGVCIYVRNMLDDWSTQLPMDVEVRRVGGPPPAAALDRAALAIKAASILRGATNTILGMMQANFTRNSQPNTVSKPFTRGGGWGYSARGSFVLADDEALLLTVDTPPDHYLGIQVTDPWLKSVDYIAASGSLNNTQAEANHDGSYSYVIALRDPGVRNWLDTAGLREGEFLLRWQDLPAATAANAIREIRRVKLSDVGALLPQMSTLTAQERQRQLAARARSHARRYLWGGQ